MSEKTLLPIGSVLNQDGRDLKIIKRLSTGLTGEVYEGTLVTPDNPAPIRVAIKVMKVLDFPMARQFFLQESETLAFLMHLEEEANKEQRLSLKIAPVYYGRGEYEGTPYLIEEFIPGEEVPSILEKKGRLPEKQALTIAWHLYRTLDILHTDLKKTYIDLKFEDLWWVNGTGNDGQLKLTDFGTLEDIKSIDLQHRGVSRDLLLAGVYLCSMLFGYTPNYSFGELKESIAPILKIKTEKELTKATARQYLDYDDLENARKTLERYLSHSTDAGVEISWGARKLLHRILHRNPASRPSSAAAIALELRALVNFWGLPEERLFIIAQNNLVEAETAAEVSRTKKQPLSQSGRDYAIRARSALDIYHILYPHKDISADLSRTDDVLAVGDYLERGLALLKGGSNAMARQVFEEGIQWSDDPALLRRWAFWARVGEEIPPSTEMPYEVAEQVINSLAAGHWDSAQDRLSEMTDKLKSKGLDYLKNEATFFARLEQAEVARAKGEFTDAAAAFQQAQDALKKYPDTDAKFIRAEEVGDLSLFIEEMKTLAATREQAQARFAEAYKILKQGTFEKVYELSWEAYTLDRSASFRFKALNDIARFALGCTAEGKNSFSVAIHTAHQVASIGKMEAPMDQELAVTCYLSDGLVKANDAIATLDAEEFRRAVAQIYAGAGQDAQLQSLVSSLLEQAEQQGEKSSSPIFVSVVADIFQERLRDTASADKCHEKAKQLEAQQINERHTTVDQKLVRIQSLLAPLSPEPGTLDKILQQAAGAADILRIVDLAELQSRQNCLEQAAENLRELSALVTVDDYRAEDLHRWNESLEKGQVLARQADVDQEKARIDYRRQRIAYLSAERMKIDENRQWLKQAPEVHAGLDFQSSEQSELIKKLLDFKYRCHQVLGEQKETDRDAAERQQKMDEYGITWEKIDELGAVKLFDQWATQTLDELGQDAWQQVKQEAEKHQVHIQDNFENAHAAFDAGDLARLSAELDRLEPANKMNLEWQKLKQDFAKVSAWKIWLEMQADRLKSGQPDVPLLRDLRAYLHSGLPPQYWQQSLAPAYLKMALENASHNFLEAAKSGHDEPIVAALHAWLNVEWTCQAENPSVQQTGSWNRDEWLKRMYRASDLNEISALVSNVPMPENIETGLSLFSVADWHTAGVRADLEDKQRAAREKARREGNKNKLNWYMLGGAGILVVLLILLAAGYFIYNSSPDYFQQLLRGTYTPTTLMATELPTEIYTETPTQTPTVSSSPTPAFSPTPMSPSGFVVAPSDLPNIYPALPVAADAAWLFDETARTDPNLDPFVNVTPPLSDSKAWLPGYRDPNTKGAINGAGKNNFYIQAGNATIVWTMDQPFDAGMYAVYILDTLKNSAGSVDFTVSLDGTVTTPVRGQNTVIFQDAGQKTDAWLPLGFYDVTGGQKMSVQVVLSALTSKTPFTLDRLLIVKISASQKTMLMDKGLPEARPLVTLLDDPNTRFYEQVSGQAPVEVKNHGQAFTDALAWNNSFLSRNKPDTYLNPIQVDWQPAGRLPVGTYELFVWIPAQHATIAANYALLADGIPIQFTGAPVAADTGPEAYLRPLNQQDHSSEWYSLGTWTLQTEASVGVRMLIAGNASGDIGVDAVAIVRVP